MPEHTAETAQKIVNELNSSLKALGPEANIEEINANIVHLSEQLEHVEHAIPNGFAIKKTATGSHVEARRL